MSDISSIRTSSAAARLRSVSPASPSSSRSRASAPPRRICTAMPGLKRYNSSLMQQRLSKTDGTKLAGTGRKDSSESLSSRSRRHTSMQTAGTAAMFLNSVSKQAKGNVIQEEGPKETSQEKKQRIRKKLRVLFWTAKMVGGVALHMRNDSMRLTEQSGMAQLYFSMLREEEEEKKREPPGGGKGLKFDKALFSRAKGSALPLPARVIASKLPQFRTEQDIQVLYRLLNSMRSFKEKLTQQMKWNVCKSAGYLSCDTGRIIFRQGHESTDFYFIYSGSVMLQVTRTDPKSGESVTNVESNIESGESFGELGLLREDLIRTGTVICREQTELFQIDKEAFLENFSELFRKELSTKMQLARNIPLLSQWSDEHLRAVCFKGVLISHPHGKVIERDWSTSKRIFFVIKGKILLLRAINVGKTDKTTDNYIEDSFGRALPCKKSKKPGQNSSRSRPKQTTTTPLSPQNTTSSSSVRQRFMAVGMLQPGESSDLRVLSKRLVEDVEPVIMVSQGCQYLRFQLPDIDENTESLAARERYLNDEYEPTDLPNVETLERHYQEHILWRQYKHQVLDVSYGESRGNPVAMRPATAKGSTGWGRWPGTLVRDLKDRACPLHPDGWSCCCPPLDNKHKSIVFE